MGRKIALREDFDGRVCDDWPRRRRMRARAVGFLRWPRFTTARSVRMRRGSVMLVSRWLETGCCVSMPRGRLA